MINLTNTDTGQTIGAVDAADLQFLIDMLEEESTTDQDYWIDLPTIDLLQARGASPELVKLLTGAIVAEEGGVNIAWDRA